MHITVPLRKISNSVRLLEVIDLNPANGSLHSDIYTLFLLNMYIGNSWKPLVTVFLIPANGVNS